jgi:hypothetical protein
MKTFQFASLLKMISLAVLSALAAFPASATEPGYPEGTQVIKNGSTPTHGLKVIQLEEMWRAGGEDSDVIFGHIFRAEADAEGNVYLVDTQLSEVPVFSPTGEHIRTLSREGEGPGETREPVDLTMMPDGTLGILQRFPGKVVKLTLDGTPAGEITIGDAASGGFNSVFTGRCRGSNLLFVAQLGTRGENKQIRTWYVSRFDAQGKELARCWERTTELDFARPVIREANIIDPVVFACAAGADGRVYLGPDRYNYAIHVYAPDGSLHHVIEREFEPRRRNDVETGRVQSVFDVWTARNPVEIETDVETIATTITALYVDNQNSLWVENSRSSEAGPDEAMLTYDVFDAEGRFDRQVALIGEGDPQDDQLFWVRDDMVVLIKGSIPALYAAMAEGAQELDEETESEPMEVVCFRVPL